MYDPLLRMREEGIPYLFCSYSSLDRYFRITEPGPVYLSTDSSLISLAKTFEDLQFPGLPLEDAAVFVDETRFIFRFVEKLEMPPFNPYTALSLLYDPQQDRFFDPRGIYRDLRYQALVPVTDSSPVWVSLFEAAKLVSRYHYAVEDAEFWQDMVVEEPPRSYQRDALLGILSGKHPEMGLSLLEKVGFVRSFWPELFEMTRIPHMKDYHPEGNAWVHTLETFQYRKRNDTTLSLALLCHDIGKPSATGAGEKPFDGHAELGARITSRFLKKLGFREELVADVTFLVRYHMFPAALKKLPLYRTEKLLESPLFPLLLDLYRADLCSSYANEDGYYEACRIYRRYLKEKANPFSAGQAQRFHRLVSGQSS